LWEEENKNVGSHYIGINEFEEHLRKLHAPKKGKAWILDIALLTGGQHEQQRFTILEVAADWHELMIPWRGMQPSTARDSGQVDPEGWHAE